MTTLSDTFFVCLSCGFSFQSRFKLDKHLQKTGHGIVHYNKLSQSKDRDNSRQQTIGMSHSNGVQHNQSKQNNKGNTGTNKKPRKKEDLVPCFACKQQGTETFMFRPSGLAQHLRRKGFVHKNKHFELKSNHCDSDDEDYGDGGFPTGFDSDDNHDRAEEEIDQHSNKSHNIFFRFPTNPTDPNQQAWYRNPYDSDGEEDNPEPAPCLRDTYGYESDSDEEEEEQHSQRQSTTASGPSLRHQHEQLLPEQQQEKHPTTAEEEKGTEEEEQKMDEEQQTRQQQKKRRKRHRPPNEEDIPIEYNFPTFEDADGCDVQYNKSLYTSYLQKLEMGYINAATLPPTQEHLLRLLKLLNDANAPLTLFDEVKEWAKLASRAGIFYPINEKELISREALMRDISKYVGMNKLVPIQKELHLPKARVDLSVTIFDAREVILSFLLDESLWEYKNLNTFELDQELLDAPRFNADDLPDEHVFGDLMSGKLAHILYEQKVQVEGKELIAPLVFFIDKTHTDRHGRLCMEPVCVTLGCFSRRTRSKPTAWRVLGYIPNSAMYMSAKKSYDKLIDHHFILSSILEGVSNLIKEGPIYWKFPSAFFKTVPESIHDRFGLIRLSLGPVLGDTQGHDQICGHYNCRSSKVPALCRKCDTPYEETSNPKYKLTLLTRKRIMDATTDADDKPACNKIAYHDMSDNKNAFQARFGEEMKVMAPYDHIAHYTPHDIMHTNNGGYILRAINAFRDEEKVKLQTTANKKQTKDTPKVPAPSQGNSTLGANTNQPQTSQQIDDTEENPDDYPLESTILNPNDLDDDTPLQTRQAASGKKKKENKNLVFSAKIKQVCEKAMLFWGHMLQQQSVRNMDRTYFPQGALSTDKLNSHELPGILLLYSCLLMSTLGDQILASKDKSQASMEHSCRGLMGDDKIDHWIYCLDSLQTHNAFLRSKTITHSELMTYEKHLERFMLLFKKTVDRTEGAGMNYPKYHAPKHNPREIQLFASLLNVDTEIGESNHKYVAKKTAKRAARNSRLLDKGASKRYHENLVIDRSAEKFCSRTGHGQERIKFKDYLEAAALHKRHICNRDITYVASRSGFFRSGQFAAFDDDEDDPSLIKATNQQQERLRFHDGQLERELSSFIDKQILPHCKDANILQCSRQMYSPEGHVYRADPAWKMKEHSQTGQGWQDWAWARWDVPVVELAQAKVKRRSAGQKQKHEQVRESHRRGVEQTAQRKKCPINILLYVTLGDLREGTSTFTINNRSISGNKTYAVCHAASQFPINEISEFSIISKFTKDLINDKTQNKQRLHQRLLYLIPLDEIIEPMIAIPDIGGPQNRAGTDRTIEDAILDKAEFLLVAHPDTWRTKFLHCIEWLHDFPLTKEEEEEQEEEEEEEQDRRLKRKRTKKQPQQLTQPLDGSSSGDSDDDENIQDLSRRKKKTKI